MARKLLTRAAIFLGGIGFVAGPIGQQTAGFVHDRNSLGLEALDRCGDKVPDSSDPEIDFYGAYNLALEDGLTLTPGFTLYHYPKAPTNAARATPASVA